LPRATRAGGHFRESQAELADIFSQFNLADRLLLVEKGKPLVINVTS
jgi:hypothetical protein